MCENVIHKVGDILDVERGVILHGCNNRGVMGSGVALALSTKYPNVKREYLSMFSKRSTVYLGDVAFVEINPHLIVANGITQDGFGNDGKRYASVEAIESCLHWCILSLIGMTIKDKCISMPEIGGLRGGLDFTGEVLPMIHTLAIHNPNITFVIYKYDNREPRYT